ncbi:laminin subunit alpha-3, partial [Tachysurus ichikawai]
MYSVDSEPELLLYVVVTSPGPFTVVMRYMTAGLHTAVRGRVLLVAGSGFYSRCSLCMCPRFTFSLQREVCVSVHANETHPPHFLILLRYANPKGAHLSGRVTVTRTRGTP